jgi:hypothetical protein
MADAPHPDGQRRSLAGILRDQSWQSVGAVATILFGLLSLAVACSIYFMNREFKSLGVTILTNTVLAKVEPSVASDITLLYKGKPADSLSLVTVKIENTGNRTIWRTDYDRPIRLVFPATTEIVDASVVEASPLHIDVSITKEQNIAIIDPVMLNQGDRFIIRLLVNNASHDQSKPFFPDVRIAGVSDVPVVNAIEQQQPSKSADPLLLAALCVVLILFLLSIGSYLSALVRRRREHESRVEAGLRQIKKGLK